MTKLTTNQKAVIVRLFVSGTSTENLAQSYGVPVFKIEQILREAMLAAAVPA